MSMARLFRATTCVLSMMSFMIRVKFRMISALCYYVCCDCRVGGDGGMVLADCFRTMWLRIVDASWGTFDIFPGSRFPFV